MQRKNLAIFFKVYLPSLGHSDGLVSLRTEGKLWNKSACQPHFNLSTDQQFLLKRLADAAIDLYGMVAILSR